MRQSTLGAIFRIFIDFWGSFLSIFGVKIGQKLVKNFDFSFRKSIGQLSHFSHKRPGKFFWRGYAVLKLQLCNTNINSGVDTGVFCNKLTIFIKK